MEETRGEKNNGKRILFILLTMFALSAGVFAVFYYQTTRPATLPAAIIKDTPYPLYFPKKLPVGYRLDTKHIEKTASSMIYTLANGDKAITVTLQPTPEDFDAAKLIGQASIPSSIISIGTMYNLSLGDGSKYMIDTKAGTLLFITAPKAVAASDITSLAQSLTKI